MYRLIIEHIVRVVILEARSQSLTRKVRDAIVASDTSHIKAAQKPNRVFAPDLSTEDLINKIEALYKVDVKVIEPKQTGSESSKFPTLEFNVEDNTVKIVHAKGIIAGAEGESKQEIAIQKQIEEFGHSITLEVVDTQGKKHTFKNIDGFIKVPGNKKADFAFTTNQQPTVFLQHKSPVHQQMSGITKFSREDYPEIDTFIKDVTEAVKSGSQDGTADGVQIYCIGDLRLEGEGAIKQLTANKIYVYPELPEGLDAPILGATYRKDRNQYGIPNVRFGIYPASYIKASE